MLSEQGANGIPGVTIKAKGRVDGETYTYEVLTDQEGNYLIEGVYYGDSTSYAVTASFPGHIFVEDKLNATLETDITTAIVEPFVDKTATILGGRVYYQTARNCGIDNVKVTLTTLSGEQARIDESHTDTNGNYSFAIDIQDQNVTAYKLKNR